MVRSNIAVPSIYKEVHDLVTWAWCQKNLINLNFNLQKSLEIFAKNSDDKIWSNRNIKVKLPCPMPDRVKACPACPVSVSLLNDYNHQYTQSDLLGLFIVTLICRTHLKSRIFPFPRLDSCHLLFSRKLKLLGANYTSTIIASHLRCLNHWDDIFFVFMLCTVVWITYGFSR